jgi:hypothetical protein
MVMAGSGVRTLGEVGVVLTGLIRFNLRLKLITPCVYPSWTLGGWTK